MAIWSRNQARQRAAELRASGKKVVFTNGCFDLLHPGHVAYLQTARRLGDFLIVGLNSDTSLHRLKGAGRPLIFQKGRAMILEALEVVDAVVIFDEDTPAALIEELKPHILVKGGDYQEKDIVGAQTVWAAGGTVRIIPYLEGFSTSTLIQKIKGEKP